MPISLQVPGAPSQPPAFQVAGPAPHQHSPHHVPEKVAEPVKSGRRAPHKLQRPGSSMRTRVTLAGTKDTAKTAQMETGTSTEAAVLRARAHVRLRGHLCPRRGDKDPHAGHRAGRRAGPCGAGGGWAAGQADAQTARWGPSGRGEDAWAAGGARQRPAVQAWRAESRSHCARTQQGRGRKAEVGGGARTTGHGDPAQPRTAAPW